METYELDALLDASADIDSLPSAVGTEPTATPGVFYHGSPLSTLAALSSQADLSEDGAGALGIYFTQIPTLAAVYSTVTDRRIDGRYYGGCGGRIYAVEIVASNPFEAPEDYFPDHPRDREHERELCELALKQGHDCIISSRLNGVIEEIIVLDASIIRQRESAGSVKDIATVSKGIFHRPAQEPDDVAPGSAPLCIHRSRAVAVSPAGRQPQATVIDVRNAIYCRADTWPALNLEVLEGLQVDCLIDPETGDALALNSERLVPLNRDMRRKFQRQQRRPSLATTAPEPAFAAHG
jgi:hypothetical protein